MHLYLLFAFFLLSFNAFSQEDSTLGLTPKMLGEVMLYQNVVSNEGSEDTLRIDSLIRFEKITEATFEELKKQSIEFIKIDSTNFKKQGDTLFLKFAESDTLLIDDPEEMEDGMKVHRYRGEIPALNQYLISRNFYESSDCALIDKTTGKTSKILLGDPFISLDTTYLLDLVGDHYDQTSDLCLFKIEEDSLTFLFSTIYLHWMPNSFLENIYWVSDSTFILKVTPSKTYWTEEGFYNKRYECIKGIILKND